MLFKQCPRITTKKTFSPIKRCHNQAPSDHEKILWYLQREITVLRQENMNLRKKNELLHAQIKNTTKELTEAQETISFRSKDKLENIKE